VIVEYRPIPTCPNYCAGSDGSVWRFSGTRRRQRKQGLTTNGYPSVLLPVIDGRHRRIATHLLVLEAFCGPRPLGAEGCHNDGNPMNNALSNLRWDSKRNNEADKKRHGTANVGSRNGRAKLTEPQVHQIKEKLSEGVSRNQVAREFGVSPRTIYGIRIGRVWSHMARGMTA
jgi:hypothetical protein